MRRPLALALSLLVASTAFAARGAVPYDASSDRLAAKHVDDVIFASRYKGQDPDTCGIQAAIDECPRGFDRGGNACIVVLPRGVCRLKRTIYVGAKPGETGSAHARSGLTLIGYGEGVKANNGVATGGTVLRWTNDATGGEGRVMISVKSASYCHLEGFSLDGDEDGDGNGAETGIRVTADNRIGVTTMNTFDRIYLNGFPGTPGILGAAIRIEPVGVDVPGAHGPNDDINAQTFTKITMGNEVELGIFQTGGQTVLTRLLDSQIKGERFPGGKGGDRAGIGVDLEQGDMSVEGSTITIGDPGPRFARYGFFVGRHANQLRIVGSTLELFAEYGVYEEDPDPAQARSAPTVVENTTLQMFGRGACGTNPPTTALRHAAGSPMLVTGSYVFPYCQAEGTRIALDGSGPYVSHGSRYGPTATVDLDASGAAPSIVADDGLLSRTDPLYATHAVDLYRTGLVLDGPTNGPSGSISFQSDGIPRARLAYNSTLLSFFDGAAPPRAPHPFLSLYPGDAARPDAARPAVILQQGTTLAFAGTDAGARTTLTAAAPTKDATITFPNASGTVLLDSTLGTALLGFTKDARLERAAYYCGPNVALCATKESGAALGVPALRPVALTCKSDTAPGSAAARWSMSLRVGGAAVGAPCEIAGSATSCTVALDGSARWKEGAEAAMRFAPDGAPADATVACAVGVRP